MKTRHEKYLGQLPTVRIEKFLRVLQETMHGKSLDEALKDIEKDFTISHLEDMNKLSDEQLQRRKELMDINFEKNRVKFGDPDFVYDKQVHTTYFFPFFKNCHKTPQWNVWILQVDFDKVQKVESGWDNENSNEEEDFW